MVAVSTVIVTTYSFEELVVPQRPSVLAYAMSLCRNKHQAEDICQEVLVKALEAWEGIDIPECSEPVKVIRGWLFTITYNHFVNTWRRGKRAKDTVENYRHQLVEASYGTTFEYNGADPREEMMAVGYSDEVTNALAVLDKDQRAVVELATAGLAYKEIAAKLGIPMGTVMSRLCRARRKLETQLADYAGMNWGLRREGAGGAGEDPAALEPAESPESEADGIDGIMAGDDGEEFVDAEAFVDPDAAW